LNTSIPALSWKHLCLIVLVIFAFRLDSDHVADLLQWIISKLLSN
jgi:hypothetical protein